MRIENEGLLLLVDDKTGCFRGVEKTTGTEWGSDPWVNSAGQAVFSVSGKRVVCDLSQARRVAAAKIDNPLGSGLRITFEDLVSTAGEVLRGSRVEAALLLDPTAAQITVKVMEVATGASDRSFVELHYPLRQFPLETMKDDGYLAVPCWQGALIPSILPRVHGPDFWQLDDAFHSCQAEMRLPATGGWHGLSMPWFGAAKGQSGFVAIIIDPEDCQVALLANYNRQGQFSGEGRESPYPRIASLSPVWLATRGKLGYPRELRYTFLRDADYVGMAKTYRSYVQSQGKLKLLPERIADCPQVERLLGATSLWLYGAYPHYARHPEFMFTWRELEKLIVDLSDNLSIGRAIVVLMDHHADEPPQHASPDPARGTDEELKRAIAVAKEKGFLVALYAVYQAALEGTPSWEPELMRYGPGGSVMQSHRWGMICSSAFKERAQRYIGPLTQRLDANAAYVDCITVEAFEECWHELHPQSRKQDAAERFKTLAYIKSLNVPVCSEAARGWAAELCDYSMGAANHATMPLALRYFDVPLFNLVYHDSLATYRHAEDDYAKSSRGDYIRRSLQDMLHGRSPNFTIAYSEYDQWRHRITEAGQVVGKFARKVAMEELTHHEVLTPDQLVQRSQFGENVEIAVNFGPAEFNAGDTRVPPFGFVILDSGREATRGQYVSKCVVQTPPSVCGA